MDAAAVAVLGALAPAIELTAHNRTAASACNETTRGWPGRMRRGFEGLFVQSECHQW